MEQATQLTTPTAPAEAREPETLGATLAQAHALVGRIMAQLTTLPRDIDMKREIDGEYSVHIMWSGDVSGVRALAARTRTPWKLIPSEYGAGTFAETRPVIDGVHVWAWTLLTPAEAETARQLLDAPETEPVPEPASEPVPLGESPVAEDAGAAYDRSLNRYVASLGGSVVALVPAVEATDDPSTISLTAVTVDTTGGEQ
ncbi:hypothetical protein PV755_00510 [Streptomyces caniscabiei]|uniref:hypothetical protein n=1 Tax=Streptomyces caniscabiei TaxID=2746961 RepID=UPI0029B793FE|nr:hypothetical protein [Streptomyces caniscabiei]MDX3507415.1 hypothetical protein [Streptomyces caniscabiei]